jgi:hypothetical protein
MFARASGKYPLTVRRKDANMRSHGEQIAELLAVIEELAGWTRAGTGDEEPGEREARDRALEVLARYMGAETDTSVQQRPRPR